MAAVAVIGAGLIGRAWAIAFARGGYDVRIHDEVPGAADKALQFAANAVQAWAAEGLLDGQSPATVAARLSVSRSAGPGALAD